MATKSELEAELAKRDETIKVFCGMLAKRNRDYRKLEFSRNHYRDHFRKEADQRSKFQIRMYAALQALHEIAGRNRDSGWPADWGSTRAKSHLKDDAIQESIDNGVVEGRRPLPKWR